MVGRTWTVPQMVAEIERDRLFHDQSGGGVTFSGGEPLLQWRFLLEVLEECGVRRIHRTVDTSGFASPEVLERVAEETDLFLYDIKTLDPRLHLEATGVPLAPILANLDRLLERGARLRVRLPLIPGINDAPADLRSVARFLSERPGIEGVNMLPFHRPARSKHERFGMPWRLGEDQAIPEDRVQALSRLLRERGLDVTIGG
jgi:pyruvate formate lyase activating enzyme